MIVDHSVWSLDTLKIGKSRRARLIPTYDSVCPFIHPYCVLLHACTCNIRGLISGVGQWVSRAIQSPLPTQQTCVVRQIQVLFWMAPGWPWGRCKGWNTIIHLTAQHWSHINHDIFLIFSDNWCNDARSRRRTGVGDVIHGFVQHGCVSLAIRHWFLRKPEGESSAKMCAVSLQTFGRRLQASSHPPTWLQNCF